VQAAVHGGSKPLIFVRPNTSDSHRASNSLSFAVNG
jgi:hypothetical protein